MCIFFYYFNMAAICQLTFRALSALFTPNTIWHPTQNNIRLYGARKGVKKLRNQGKKVKKQEEIKKEWVPPSVLKKLSAKPVIKKKIKEEVLRPSVDDVWVTTWHAEKIYTLSEALDMHREANHPSLYNKPDALVQMHLDLNMTLAKKTKFLDAFKKVIMLPHPLDHGERRVVAALAKNEEIQALAKNCGADIVGGLELIKMIQKGELTMNECDVFVCHNDIIMDLIPLKGVFRHKFPNKYKDTLGTDMEAMVNLYKLGCEYEATKDDNSPEKAKLSVKVGHLNMEISHLEANINTTIKSICKHRSSKLGPFIKKAFLLASPNEEVFPIVIDQFLPEVIIQDDDQEVSAAN